MSGKGNVGIAKVPTAAKKYILKLQLNIRSFIADYHPTRKKHMFCKVQNYANLRGVFIQLEVFKMLDRKPEIMWQLC